MTARIYWIKWLDSGGSDKSWMARSTEEASKILGAVDGPVKGAIGVEVMASLSQEEISLLRSKADSPAFGFHPTAQSPRKTPKKGR